MNKLVNGKQLTVMWHTEDDLKTSHCDEEVVDAMLKDPNEEFGVESSLMTTTGKVHDCLGMTLDHLIPIRARTILVPFGPFWTALEC